MIRLKIKNNKNNTMKKILFVICAVVCFGFASCTGCRSEQQHCDQDTVTVNDTVVVETFDTVYAD
jgi:hypothetical protein